VPEASRPDKIGVVRILRPLLRGAVAGSIGTLAMDRVWYARYRRGGGDAAFRDWEIASGIERWEDAPAPGRMGRKIIELVTGRDVPVERAAALSNLMHWAYGLAWTATYGVLVGDAGVRRALWHGPAFGAAVWSSDYVTLPLAGIYEPIWKYDASTLYEDLSAHVVFGTVADVVLRLVPGD
jgi:hypothetical protein